MNEPLDQLAYEMFLTFARFEYALKASNFRNRNGTARAKWRMFAESQTVRCLFENWPVTENQCPLTYILDHPPKKRIVRDGELTWCDAPPDTDLLSDRVLIYVRRVRNNLFHGDKFNPAWTEPERTEGLLNASLTILRHCLEVSTEVRDAYDGRT